MVYPGGSQPVLTTAQLFNPLVPKVSITRVTLDMSVPDILERDQYEAVYDKNPHIDVATNYSAKEKVLQVEGLGGSQDLRVVVDVEIEDPNTSSILDSVLDTVAIRNALTIRLLHTDNRSLFETTFESGGLANAVSSMTSNDFILDGKEAVRETNANGKQIRIYTHTFTFIIPRSSNLGLVAYAYLDLSALTFPSTISAPTDPNLNLASSPTFLWVLTGGSVTSTTLYRDEKGNTQSIPINKVQDFRIANEVEHLDFNFTLTEEDIYPYLQKDLYDQRININPADTNFSEIFLSRDINNRCRFFFSINWKKIIIENSLFGKLFMENQGQDFEELISRTSIESLKILRERVQGSSQIGSTPYYKISSNTAVPDLHPTPDLFDQNAIPKLVIEGTDHPFVPLPTVRAPNPFPSSGPQPQQPVASVIEGFRTFSNWQPTDLEPGGSLTEKMGFADKDSESALRHFTGTDGFVENETDGYFRYAVEISGLDVSVEIIEEKYQTLREQIKEVLRYYEASIMLDRSSALPPDYSPHIDVPNEEEYEPGAIIPGSFNAKTKRFNPAFQQNWTVQTAGPPGANDPLIFPLLDAIAGSGGFVGILKFFSTKTNRFTDQPLWTTAYYNKIQNGLLEYLNPYTATPESIKIVLELMQGVASKIDSMLGVVYTRHFGTQTTLTQNQPEVVERHIASKNRLFKVEEKSSYFFNANLTRNLGFDFLNTTHYEAPWNNNFGLFEIPQSHILEQARYEQNRFFVPAGTAAASTTNALGQTSVGLTTTLELPDLFGNNLDVWRVDTTKGTYFTPHVIMLPDERISTVPSSAWETQHPPGISTVNANDPKDFLRPISYSLCERRFATDFEWLETILSRASYGQGSSHQSWVNPAAMSLLGSARYEKDRFSLANDLAGFFALYHDTTIMSSDNQALARSRSILDAFRDDFIKTNDLKERGKMYGAFMEIVETLTFKRSQKTAISNSHLSKRKNWNQFYDCHNYNSKIYEQFDGAPQHQIRLHNTPVQVKALLWKNSLQGTHAQVTQFFNDVTDPQPQDQKFDSDPAYQYTTQIINKVEAVRGYKTNSQGDILLKEPIWEPLKNIETDLFADRGGSGVNSFPADSLLLCRCSSHVDGNYLIERDDNYNLPTYDEYFLMTEG